jgi:hypothetical protein
MSSRTDETKQGFFSRYKKLLIVIVVLYIVLTLALILVSRSDSAPFRYQVF